MQSKEVAEALWYNAQSISQLIYAGYDAASARDAIVKNDLSLLKVKEKEENKKNDR